MKSLLKKSFLLLIFSYFFALNVSSQIPKYHRIKATIPKQKFQEIMLSGLEIDHYEFHNNILVADVSDNDVALLKKNNIKVIFLIRDLANNITKYNEMLDKKADANPVVNAVTVPTPVNFGTGGSYGPAVGVAKHFTFQEMQNELDDMHALYPNLINIKSSIGTTDQGRSLFMVRISDNPDVDENEPEVFLNAVHHAREPISMTQLIFFMWHMLENYNSDKEIKTLLNSTELYIIPCINPDGYVYNQTTNPTGGGFWRKNRHNNGDGTFGVDNNRNYGYGWGGSGSSTSTNSDTYRGTAPFSEVENISVRNFCNSRNFVSEFNYHSYGNFCVYPYSFVAVNNNPEIQMFNQLSVFLTTDNIFAYGNSTATVQYIASGGAEDWAYGEQLTKGKMYGFTPEVGTSNDGFYPASSRIIPLCNSMIVMNKNLLKVSTKYGVVTTSAPASVTSLNNTIPFSLKNFSIYPATYTVSLVPLTAFITTVDPPKIISSSTIFQTQNDLFNFTISASTPSGTNLSLEVNTDNGYTIRKDTITILYTCSAPVGMSTTSITSNSANVSWTNLNGATNYYLSYKLASSSTWGADVLVSNSNASSLNGLFPNTVYNWRVRSISCSLNSTEQSFTTLDVTPGTVYCTSNGTNNVNEWIDYIQLASINRNSGIESGGYANTGILTNLVRNNKYTIIYSAGFSSTIFKENWKIFIDFNSDGDFADSHENILNTSRTGAGNYTVAFTVPKTAALGATHMRVKMSRSSIANSCGSFTDGEVEDYTITMSNTEITVDDYSDGGNIVGSNPTDLQAEIMPNPFDDKINIFLKEKQEHETIITLLEINGRVLYKQFIDEDVLHYQINTTGIENGVYILVIQSGERKTTFKLVK